ncbi:hypothetical protein QQ045_020462 [Rhodiola kirilowii]
MGSVEVPLEMRSSALTETSCGYLLQELRVSLHHCKFLMDGLRVMIQMIWDEVGEDEHERERTLLDLEQECLSEKSDNANMSRVRLHQELAEAEAEFTHLLLSLRERSLPAWQEKMAGTLKEQLNSITPALREMQLRKEDRVNQLRAVQGQIQKISAEIAGQSIYNDSASNVLENSNKFRQLPGADSQLEVERIGSEEEERELFQRKEAEETTEFAKSLGIQNISDDIMAKLSSMAKFLDEEKKNRLDKLRHLGKALTNLWNLMDTPYEDRQMFYNITKLLSVSAADICRPGSLTVHIIEKVQILRANSRKPPGGCYQELQAACRLRAEVHRLDEFKSKQECKMKELFLKKQVELEEIYSKTHMENPFSYRNGKHTGPL